MHREEKPQKPKVILDALDLQPESEATTKLQEYNDSLPHFSLTAEQVSEAFRQQEDKIRVIGPKDRDRLIAYLGFGDDITGLELSALLIGDVLHPDPEDTKRLNTHLFMEEGMGLIDALEEAADIEQDKMLQGLEEAAIMLDALVVDPAATASGHELITALTKAIDSPPSQS